MTLNSFAPFVLALFVAQPAFAQTVITFAGLPHNYRAAQDSHLATDVSLNNVYGLLFDRLTGRLLFHDTLLVNRLEPDGSLLSIAGIGRRGSDGDTADGTLASNLTISILRGMAQDSAGNLFLADVGAGRIYRVAVNGTVTTYAGSGRQAGDGGPATMASLPSPRGLAFDSKGNLYVAEIGCGCIRQISPAGIISTLYAIPLVTNSAGNILHSGYFEGLAIDSQDNVYATEYAGHVVLKISPSGDAATIAGTGVAGLSGDGGPATAAQLNSPSGVTLDTSGNIFIADTRNNRIRRIAADGTISTFVGVDSSLNAPAQTLLDANGNMFIADFNNRRVLEVLADGSIVTVAGGNPDAPFGTGDGGPAINAVFNNVTGLAFDPFGNLFAADVGANRIRRIAPDGTVTTVAGTGDRGQSGDGGPAIQATLSAPNTVATDCQGTVYIASLDSTVRKINTDGTIVRVAGKGTGSGLIRSQGDGGPAVNAVLNEPKGVAPDAQGNVYIADTSNAELRKVDTNGIINKVAGPGALGTDYWNAVTLDPRGNVYVATTHAVNPGLYSVIDKLNPDGSFTPVAGKGSCDSNALSHDFPYDGAQAAQVPLCVILGMTFDPQGVLYFIDNSYGAILRVAQDGTITRVAGTNSTRKFADGGPAQLANLGGEGIAIDSQGNLFIAQGSAGRIREVLVVPPLVELSASAVSFQGRAPDPQTVQVSTSVAEPFPFSVKIKTTSGGNWLSANRVTGQTGDILTVYARTDGLTSGTYQGTISIAVMGLAPNPAALPVTLVIP